MPTGFSPTHPVRRSHTKTPSTHAQDVQHCHDDDWRYNPLAPTSASSAPLKRYNADERDDDDNDDGDESERETVPQPEPEKVVTAFNRKDKLVTVRSEFASLFRKADGSREAPLAQDLETGMGKKLAIVMYRGAPSLLALLPATLAVLRTALFRYLFFP